MYVPPHQSPWRDLVVMVAGSLPSFRSTDVPSPGWPHERLLGLRPTCFASDRIVHQFLADTGTGRGQGFVHDSLAPESASSRSRRRCGWHCRPEPVPSAVVLRRLFDAKVSLGCQAIRRPPPELRGTGLRSTPFDCPRFRRSADSPTADVPLVSRSWPEVVAHYAQLGTARKIASTDKTKPIAVVSKATYSPLLRFSTAAEPLVKSSPPSVCVIPMTVPRKPSIGIAQMMMRTRPSESCAASASRADSSRRSSAKCLVEPRCDCLRQQLTQPSDQLTGPDLRSGACSIP